MTGILLAGIGRPVYQPNSFQGPVDDARYREPALRIRGAADRYDHHWAGNEDYYTQAGNLFRLMDTAARERLVDNLVGALQGVPQEIRMRQIGHFFRADPVYGEAVARGLGIGMEEVKTVA